MSEYFPILFKFEGWCEDILIFNSTTRKPQKKKGRCVSRKTRSICMYVLLAWHIDGKHLRICFDQQLTLLARRICLCFDLLCYELKIVELEKLLCGL